MQLLVFFLYSCAAHPVISYLLIIYFVCFYTRFVFLCPQIIFCLFSLLLCPGLHVFFASFSIFMYPFASVMSFLYIFCQIMSYQASVFFFSCFFFSLSMSTYATFGGFLSLCAPCLAWCSVFWFLFCLLFHQFCLFCLLMHPFSLLSMFFATLHRFSYIFCLSSVFFHLSYLFALISSCSFCLFFCLFCIFFFKYFSYSESSTIFQLSFTCSVNFSKATQHSGWYSAE